MAYVLGLDSTNKVAERIAGTATSQLLQWNGSSWDLLGGAVGTPLTDLFTGALTVVGAKDLLWNTDGGGDIGASGATRPDTVYAKTSVVIAGSTAMKSGDTAAGDLSGTYPSPSVVADSHAHTATSITLASTNLTDTASLLYTTTTFGGDVGGQYGSIQCLGSSGDFAVGNLLGLHDFGAGAHGASVTGQMWISDPSSSMKVLNYYDAAGGVPKIVVDATTVFVGDVTGTYGATVVGNDSHDHTTTTITLALSALSDTTITSPADGALLLYDTGTSKWRDAPMYQDAVITDVGAVTVQGIRGNNIYTGASSPSNRNVLFWDNPFSEWDVGYLALTDMSDVYASMSPSDNDILTYDTTNGWQAQSTLDVTAITMTGSSGIDMLWATDGGGDIGASSASRPDKVYAKTSVTSGNTTTMFSDRIRMDDAGASPPSTLVNGDFWFDDNGLNFYDTATRTVTHSATALAGDVTGTVGANVVTKIRGDAVVDNAPNDFEALVWESGAGGYLPTPVCRGEIHWFYAQRTLISGDISAKEYTFTIPTVTDAEFVVALDGILTVGGDPLNNYGNPGFYDSISAIIMTSVTEIWVILGSDADVDDILSVTYGVMVPDL
jgi:hypothetical protein